MAVRETRTLDIIFVPAASLANQDWWPQLHEVIISAFLHKPENVTVFPPDWKRLPDDPATAAHSLASELGNEGHLIVLLESGRPTASTGVLPYRGASWINDAQDGKSDTEIANDVSSKSPSAGGAIAEWEVCCFCVCISHRQRGLSYRLLSTLESFITDRGAKRLYASYAEVETGNFWPRMGFQAIPGAGGMLKKGFKVNPEKEGLKGNITFTMAMKRLGN